jgi:hypothetical protein
LEVSSIFDGPARRLAVNADIDRIFEPDDFRDDRVADR